MEKLADWRTRLDECIFDYEAVAFKYGKYDCSTFVADCVYAQTGIEFGFEFRGKYRTGKGGYKLLRKAGYKSYINFVETHLTEIHPAFASFGDVGVVQANSENEALVIMLGNFAIGITELGLIRFDVSRVTRVFKI